jgi:hypothetical protein
MRGAPCTDGFPSAFCGSLDHETADTLRPSAVMKAIHNVIETRGKARSSFIGFGASISWARLLHGVRPVARCLKSRISPCDADV